MTFKIAQQRLAFLLPHMTGGGAERVALRLIQDFVAQGHPVDLLLMTEWGELLPLLPPSVRVIDLHAPRIRDAIRPLIRYLRTEQPEGLQAFMWPLTVAAAVAHRFARSKARLVLSEHITLSKQYSHFNYVRRTLLRNSIRFAYPLASSRVAVSVQAADDLAAVGGLDRSSITVIYNPVDRPSDAGLNPESLKAARTAWGDAETRIITVGKLKAQKNQALLIEAFALLRRTRPARLVILGEGELRGELEALVAARSLGGDVVLPGFFTDPWPFYDGAQIFALSSHYEGYPLVLVEAMRAGLSIVSTDCPSGPHEILDGGTFGRLVPCDDAAALALALAQMLDQPADPAVMRTRAEALSGQDASDQYLALMLK
ncbi:glycosyltransferase [Sphingomonas sp. CROZ-RG-20F-R02-07]|uniref:glycosyltransferase n=1 Tax=Sphingomonas sp. CROZ-RG-20F-R02-07 TaxID=2914832 RepID=UPI001F56EB75|nr:glycosyltransferase [Sphingomonas sp. CROZ-RG-20F-R02-07]